LGKVTTDRKEYIFVDEDSDEDKDNKPT